MQSLWERSQSRREASIIRATIKTIAEKTGVSKSTVARVLNGENGVRPEVRQRVLQAASKLQYHRNSLGRALRTQRQAMRFAVLLHKNEFVDSVCQGMRQAQDELSDYGVELVFFHNDKKDYRTQAALLERLEKSQIAGVILKPIDHPAIRDGIDRLANRNVPVVTVISDLEESRRMCFVGQDIRKSGRTAGHLMGILLGGAGNVAVFKEEDEGANSFERRTKGFRDELSERYPGIRLLEQIPILENAPENYGIARQYALEHPELNGVLVAGSSHTEIAKGIRDAGRAREVRLVCYDIFPETEELMRQGAIDFVITQSPVTEGYNAVKTLFEFVFAGTKPPRKTMYMTTGIKEIHTIGEEA